MKFIKWVWCWLKYKGHNWEIRYYRSTFIAYGIPSSSRRPKWTCSRCKCIQL